MAKNESRADRGEVTKKSGESRKHWLQNIFMERHTGLRHLLCPTRQRISSSCRHTSASYSTRRRTTIRSTWQVGDGDLARGRYDLYARARRLAGSASELSTLIGGSAALFGEFLGGSRRTIGLFAVWQPPLALFAKWQGEKFAERQLVFVSIRGHANRDFVLWNVAPQGAMKFVPPAKNRAPIGVCLALDNGMMNAVHTRRDDDQVQKALKPDWQSPVGMMKDGRGFEGDEKDEQHHRRDPEDEDGEGEKSDGEKHFTEMEARGGARIHVEISVMHSVKPPEQR